MKYFHFLIFIAIFSFLAGGLTYIGQQFLNSQSASINSKLQANLLALELNGAQKLKQFEALEEEKKGISLLFVGDIMLSRGVANQIIIHNNDYDFPFLKIASTTTAADLAFGNLEGPISDGGKNQGSIYSFRANPVAAKGLKFAGFDILNLANNHIMDWGGAALKNTINTLEQNQIHWIGAGRNETEANSPLIVDIRGVKIALLGFTNLYPKSLEAKGNNPGVSHFDVSSIKNQISKIKNANQADIIIISFHWGEEYQTKANESQKRIAHELINAGADLIVGHHPHVIQEVENYNSASSTHSGFIDYSLGNFIFDQNFSKETNQGLMLKAIIKDKKISDVEPINIIINKTFQPELNTIRY